MRLQRSIGEPPFTSQPEPRARRGMQKSVRGLLHAREHCAGNTLHADLDLPPAQHLRGLANVSRAQQRHASEDMSTVWNARHSLIQHTAWGLYLRSDCVGG